MKAELIEKTFINAGFMEITFTNDAKPNEYKYLFTVNFPNSYKSISVYSENESTDNLIIEFALNPECIYIPFSKLKSFISEIIQPGLLLPTLSETAFSSWSRPRSKGLLHFENQKRDFIYLGLDDMSFYSELYHKFLSNPLLYSACINEAGMEGSAWGAAQFKTAYSGSYINYEAVTTTDQEDSMVYTISFSYFPSSFGKETLVNSTLSLSANSIPEDMPIDLVLALDGLGFHYGLSSFDLANRISTEHEDSLYYLSILLENNPTRLISYLPNIHKNKDHKISKCFNDWAIEKGFRY